MTISIQEVKVSAQSYLLFLKLIDRHRLWKNLIIPMIISLSIAILIGIFAIHTSKSIITLLLDTFQISQPLTAYQSILKVSIILLSNAFLLFLYLKLYRYLILIFLAPFYVRIITKIHVCQTGKDRIHEVPYWKFTLRGLGVTMKNFLLESLFTFCLCILIFLWIWLIPVAPFVLVLMESYFFGYSMMDYRNTLSGLNLKESRIKINNQLGATIGIGLIFNLLLLVPLLGVILAPVLAIGAAESSIFYLENNNYYADSIHQSIQQSTH